LKLQINENFRVTGIPNNYVLEERKTNKKTGEEYWDGGKYYGNLEQLFTALLNRQLLDSETEGVKALIDEIRVSVAVILEQIRILQGE
jgi:hypothetical protein